MAIKIKSAAAIAKKWATVTPQRSTIWQEEVAATPDGDWADPAVAAGPTWAQAVTEAAGRGSFAAGIEAARPKWKRKALALGPGRYGPGVMAAEADHVAGFGPYQAVIAGLTLTPRGPRGSPGNFERVRQVGDALHRRRVGG